MGLGLVVRIAAAEPMPVGPPPTPSTSIGVGATLAIERFVAAMYTAEAAHRLRGAYWLDGAASIGGAAPIDPAGSGFDGSRAYEVRIGIARLGCGELWCSGAIASAGYHFQWTHYEDALTDLMSWTEKRGLVFGELRGVARLQLGRHAAFEVALGLRVHDAVFTEYTDGGVNVGVVGALGVHAVL